MIAFSKWVENLQQAVGAVRDDRKDLGAQGFEGLQDAMEALKMIARDPKNSSSLNNIFTRLAALVSRQDADLSSRLASSARKFVSVSKNMGLANANPAPDQQNNQTARTA